MGCEKAKNTHAQRLPKMHWVCTCLGALHQLNPLQPLKHSCPSWHISLSKASLVLKLLRNAQTLCKTNKSLVCMSIPCGRVSSSRACKHMLHILLCICMPHARHALCKTGLCNAPCKPPAQCQPCFHLANTQTPCHRYYFVYARPCGSRRPYFQHANPTAPHSSQAL